MPSSFLNIHPHVAAWKFTYDGNRIDGRGNPKMREWKEGRTYHIDANFEQVSLRIIASEYAHEI